MWAVVQKWEKTAHCAHFFQPQLRKTDYISAGSDRSNLIQKIQNAWLELLYHMTKGHYPTNDFETRVPYGGLLFKNGGSIKLRAMTNKVKKQSFWIVGGCFSHHTLYTYVYKWWNMLRTSFMSLMVMSISIEPFRISMACLYIECFLCYAYVVVSFYGIIYLS